MIIIREYLVVKCQLQFAIFLVGEVKPILSRGIIQESRILSDFDTELFPLDAM